MPREERDQARFSMQHDEQEFANQFERLQSLCRRAKDKVQAALDHLQAIPDLEQAVQGLFALGERGGQGEAHLQKAIDEHRDLLLADADALEELSGGLEAALDDCLSRINQPEFERQVRAPLGDVFGRLRDAVQGVTRARIELENVGESLR